MTKKLMVSQLFCQLFNQKTFQLALSAVGNLGLCPDKRTVLFKFYLISVKRKVNSSKSVKGTKNFVSKMDFALFLQFSKWLSRKLIINCF